MSLWLPRPAPPLVARISNHPSSHILHPRIILAYRYSKHIPTQPLSLRLQSTHSSSDSSRNASTSTSSHVTPTSEPKPTPPPSQPKDVSTVKAPLMTRAWKKVKHEAAHYWAGSKLLVSEVRISARLQWKILHGESLTRRERRQVSACSYVTVTISEGRMLAAQTYHSRSAEAHPVCGLCDRPFHGILAPRSVEALP